MRNYSKTGNTYFSTRSNAQLSRNCATIHYAFEDLFTLSGMLISAKYFLNSPLFASLTCTDYITTIRLFES